MRARTEVVSAGAVVVRRGPQGARVLVLHHRAYDEWRLPKGKLKVGETAARAAERELEEEAGLPLQAGRYLGATAYTYCRSANGTQAHKIVYFFALAADEDAQARPESGVFDAAEWLPAPEALQRLTWENEREMVRLALRPR